MFARVYRITALLVVLLAAAEVFACNLIAPPSCEIAGSTDNGCDPDDGSSGDGCLCCCRHIVVVPAMVFAPAIDFEFTPDPAETIRIVTVPDPIDHPPRV